MAAVLATKILEFPLISPEGTENYSCARYISDSAILNCLALSQQSLIKATKDTTDICRDIASDDVNRLGLCRSWYERLDVDSFEAYEEVVKKNESESIGNFNRYLNQLYENGCLDHKTKMDDIEAQKCNAGVMSNGSTMGEGDGSYLSNNAECPIDLPCPSELKNTESLDALTRNVYHLLESDDLALIKREYSSILRAEAISDIQKQYYDFFGGDENAISFSGACANEYVRSQNSHWRKEYGGEKKSLEDVMDSTSFLCKQIKKNLFDDVPVIDTAKKRGKSK